MTISHVRDLALFTLSTPPSGGGPACPAKLVAATSQGLEEHERTAPRFELVQDWNISFQRKQQQQQQHKQCWHSSCSNSNSNRAAAAVA